MVGEWREARLGDLVTHQKGFAFKSSDYRTSGHPIVRVSNFTDRSINMAECSYLSPDYASQFSAYRLNYKDVVLATVGSWPTNPASVVGKTISVPKDADGALLNQNAVRLLAKNVLDQVFLFYRLRNEDFQTYLVGTAQGSASQASVTLNDIFGFEFLLPPLVEQRAIAHILGTLDDKIELNCRRNQTLEAMARALFQDWFVDFGPVRAKMEGREPYLPADLWQLFPDRLDNKGKPEGWVVGTVADLCSSITSGGTPARKKAIFWDGGTIPWFKTGELQDGPLLDSEEKITEAALIGSSCKLWPAGTILFALYASPTVGRLGLLTSPGTSNQAAAGLIAKEAIGVPFLRRVLLEAREKLQNIAVGAAQQNINQAILKAHQLVMPPECLSAHYSELVGYWDDQQIQLAYEMKTLARLRDTLLPKLISGELRIADAKRFVKDHLP